MKKSRKDEKDWDAVRCGWRGVERRKRENCSVREAPWLPVMQSVRCRVPTVCSYKNTAIDTLIVYSLHRIFLCIIFYVLFYRSWLDPYSTRPRSDLAAAQWHAQWSTSGTSQYHGSEHKTTSGCSNNEFSWINFLSRQVYMGLKSMHMIPRSTQ